VCDDHVFHSVVPQTEVNDLAEEPGADDLEFTSEDTASVNVARKGNQYTLKLRGKKKIKIPGVRLETFIVAKNLTS
jgi:hypothetical protein